MTTRGNHPCQLLPQAARSSLSCPPNPQRRTIAAASVTGWSADTPEQRGRATTGGGAAFSRCAGRSGMAAVSVSRRPMSPTPSLPCVLPRSGKAPVSPGRAARVGAPPRAPWRDGTIPRATVLRPVSPPEPAGAVASLCAPGPEGGATDALAAVRPAGRGTIFAGRKRMPHTRLSPAPRMPARPGRSTATRLSQLPSSHTGLASHADAAPDSHGKVPNSRRVSARAAAQDCKGPVRDQSELYHGSAKAVRRPVVSVAAGS